MGGHSRKRIKLEKRHKCLGKSELRVAGYSIGLRQEMKLRQVTKDWDLCFIWWITGSCGRG